MIRLSLTAPSAATKTMIMYVVFFSCLVRSITATESKYQMPSNCLQCATKTIELSAHVNV